MAGSAEGVASGDATTGSSHTTSAASGETPNGKEIIPATSARSASERTMSEGMRNRNVLSR